MRASALRTLRCPIHLVVRNPGYRVSTLEGFPVQDGGNHPAAIWLALH
jgi:hypothetical protein